MIGHESCDEGSDKTREREKAQTQGKTKILVVVPPVLKQWKNGDIPRIDALNDDTGIAIVAEQTRSASRLSQPDGLAPEAARRDSDKDMLGRRL